MVLCWNIFARSSCEAPYSCFFMLFLVIVLIGSIWKQPWGRECLAIHDWLFIFCRTIYIGMVIVVEHVLIREPPRRSSPVRSPGRGTSGRGTTGRNAYPPQRFNGGGDRGSGGDIYIYIFIISLYAF